MPTAPAADQRRLLDLQALDTRAQQLAHQHKTLPERARVSELADQLADLDDSLVQSRTAVNDLRRELTKAEGDVEQVRSRALRDQHRLDAGQVNAKDAQALVAELETLARRQSVLEDVELEVMERLEAHERALSDVQSARDALSAAYDAAVSEQDGKLAIIDVEADRVAGERAVIASSLDAGLVALYERVRDNNGGRGVVSLRGATLDGLNVAIATAELAAIQSAPSDQVIRLEDYGHIVVRLDS